MDQQAPKAFFVTGIGTDVGKTIVSAILAEALQAHYWKPIQSGDLENSDSKKIDRWTSNVKVIDEEYRLTNPLSPHTSARMDGIVIPADISLPAIENILVVEGAGGVLVPINDDGDTISDLLKNWKIPVIVVVKHYLGSINHSLLTLEYLRQHEIPIAGVVVSGERHEESEQIIERITGQKVDLNVLFSERIDKEFIKQQAAMHKEKIKQWLLG